MSIPLLCGGERNGTLAYLCSIGMTHASPSCLVDYVISVQSSHAVDYALCDWRKVVFEFWRSRTPAQSFEVTRGKGQDRTGMFCFNGQQCRPIGTLSNL